jgi:hypothetical protein
MEFLAESIIWMCAASSSTRSYAVESFDRTAPSFMPKVYSAPHFNPNHYQEEVLMQLSASSPAHSLMSTGTLKSGERLRVTAFAENSVTFQVNDAQGHAIGHCVRNITEN